MDEQSPAGEAKEVAEPQVPSDEATTAQQIDQQDSQPSAQPDQPDAALGDTVEPEKPKTALQKELEKVQQNPADFNQWVAMEKMTETEKDIETIRQVYDGLLSEYPLCYGYWKKYAEAEQKHRGSQWANHVFERGTAAVPYSVDLWGHYCIFKQKIPAPADEIRKTFEDGIAYVGTDYLAHGLWDKYIKFETEQGSPELVANLYRRIMDCPLKELDRYHSSLETFAAKHQATELLTKTELEELRETISSARKKQKSATEAAPDSEAAQDGADKAEFSQANTNVEMADVGQVQGTADTEPTSTINGSAEGLVPPETAAGGDAAPVTGTPEGETAAEAAPGVSASLKEGVDPAAASPDATAPITDQEVKGYWLSLCESAHEDSKKELARRMAFDTVLKRPYFHVKPLPTVQLNAWNSYIDYILTKEDPGTIVRLFERCLVACASYPEFWIRYVRYTESKDPSGTAAILNRAQQLFCKNDVSLNLFAAKCQERSGEIESARTSYKRVVEDLAPGLISAILQAASFERRQSDLAAAKAFFENVLNADDQEEGGGSAKATLTVFYARFLFVDCQDVEAARAVFERSLTKYPSEQFLWEAAIHLEEYSQASDATERVIDLYQKAIAALGDAKAVDESGLEVISQQLLDFADRRASPDVFEKLQAAHTDKYNPYKQTSSAKRSAEDLDAGPAAKRPATMSTYPDPSTQHVPGALPGPPPGPAAPQMHAGYAAPIQYGSTQDPYAAQAYAPANVPYNYGDYYQYPQPAQYANYQYTGYQ